MAGWILLLAARAVAGSGFEDAVLLEKPKLAYPDAEYAAGIEGWTLLSYVVTRDGAVVDLAQGGAVREILTRG